MTFLLKFAKKNSTLTLLRLHTYLKQNYLKNEPWEQKIKTWIFKKKDFLLHPTIPHLKILSRLILKKKLKNCRQRWYALLTTVQFFANFEHFLNSFLITNSTILFSYNFSQIHCTVTRRFSHGGLQSCLNNSSKWPIANGQH